MLENHLYTDGEKNCDKNICLLDSAGNEGPLMIDEIQNKVEEQPEKKYEFERNYSVIEKLSEISKDKQQTESFIEELIIALSDMLILVVGKLT